MKNNILIMAVVLFSIIMITETFAQPLGRGRGSDQEPGWRLSSLDLTDDQQEKIEKLRTDHRKQISKMNDDLDRMRIDKREMMRQDNLNRSEYLNLEKSMSSLREKIQLARAEFRMNVYELLDPEQRKQLSDNNFGSKNRRKAGAFFKRGPCW